jgi:2-dehydropantoate 2-reductase
MLPTVARTAARIATTRRAGMRIGIIGAGAIGSVVGGMLTKAGRDVTLIDQWPEHVETMRAKGLRLSGTCGDHVVPVQAIHIHELQSVEQPFDAVFISVKSYDTQWATSLALGYVKPGGCLVDFQNGMNDERVAAIAGKDRVLGCVITIGAMLLEAGHARRTDSGQVGFKVGELDGAETPRARELATIMGDVAPSKLTTNLMGERWSKLAVNCMANPLAGLSGLGSGEVRSERGPCLIGIQIGGEVVKVARASGFEVEPIFGIPAQRYVDGAEGRDLEKLYADIAESARFLTGGRPSLLQDVLKGRRTEIDYLNGWISQQGRKVGVKTPFNDAITELIRSHGVGRLKPDPKNLEPLLRMLPS